jgi:hypothetical protein
MSAAVWMFRAKEVFEMLGIRQQNYYQCARIVPLLFVVRESEACK